MGKSERTKGHNFERERRDWWRQMGYDQCHTSRYASRMHDDAKVDLVNTGIFNEQCKYWQKQPNFFKTLSEMPDDSNINIVVHRKARQEATVTMTLNDFEEIMKMLISNKILKP